jgi:hypothetical protein
MKIRPVGAQLPMRTDGRTNGRRDMSKLTVAFRNFANAPKKTVTRTVTATQMNHYEITVRVYNF